MPAADHGARNITGSEITVEDRLRASNIVADLRRGDDMHRVAGMLGISTVYCHFAHGIYHRGNKAMVYLCPKWVIRKILDFGQMKGRAG